MSSTMTSPAPPVPTDVSSAPPADPTTQLPSPHGGVKRRKSDGKRLHSPPKRQRVAADAPLEDVAEDVLLSDPAVLSDGERASSVAEERSERGERDELLEEDLLPALQGLTTSVVRLLKRVSPAQLRTHSNSGDAPNARSAKAALRLLDMTARTLDEFEEDCHRQSPEHVQTLQCATLMSALHLLLQRSNDSIAPLTSCLNSFVRISNEDGIAWILQFIDSVMAKANDGEAFSSDTRHEETVASMHAGILELATNASSAETRAVNPDDGGASSPLASAADEATNAPIALVNGDTTTGSETYQPLAGIGTPLDLPATNMELDPFADSEFDFMAIARRAAQSALNPDGDEAHQDAGAADRSAPNRQAQAVPAAAKPAAVREMPTRPGPSTGTQPAATSRNASLRNGTLFEQYERARAFASTRAQQKRQVVTSNSSRRPWTTAEEDALMQGLDELQGPYWSQILAKYGENGTVSSVLAGRTQVQLKDKARNLKLYFLKNNQPLPKSLTHVTGDLKTRAPLHLARDEAERQGRSSEDMGVSC